MILRLFLTFFILLCIGVSAQEEDVTKTDSNGADLVVVGEEKLDTISATGTKDPLRASLYSAVIPGLGQAYNEKYWKIPIIAGLLGTGTGFILFYHGEYRDFRDAFLAERNGQTHQFTELGLSVERLGDLQDDRRRTRDYAIAITSLFYILNVLDATVDAHLFDFDTDVDLSWNPNLIYDQVSGQPYYGVTLKMKF